MRFEHLARSALKHDFPTLSAGTGTDVDDIISFGHHVAVVLDDDHGVACVTKCFQTIDEIL